MHIKFQKCNFYNAKIKHPNIKIYQRIYITKRLKKLCLK